MKDKVILAYSGGLDTTAIIPWLKENYDYEDVYKRQVQELIRALRVRQMNAELFDPVPDPGIKYLADTGGAAVIFQHPELLRAELPVQFR